MIEEILRHFDFLPNQIILYDQEGNVVDSIVITSEKILTREFEDFKTRYNEKKAQWWCYRRFGDLIEIEI